MIATVVAVLLPVGAAWQVLQALRLRPATDSRLTAAAVACCLGIGLSSVTTFAAVSLGLFPGPGVRRRAMRCCGSRLAGWPGASAAASLRSLPPSRQTSQPRP